jgi:hypothetical protein
MRLATFRQGYCKLQYTRQPRVSQSTHLCCSLIAGQGNEVAAVFIPGHAVISYVIAKSFATEYVEACQAGQGCQVLQASVSQVRGAVPVKLLQLSQLCNSSG